MKKIDVDLSTVEWQRSPESKPGENCVEIANLPEGHIGMRDGAKPDGPVLIFTPAEWKAFLLGVKDGEFNRPGTGSTPPAASGESSDASREG